MADVLDSAIDQVTERVDEICGFLKQLDDGKPVDQAALKTAVHDCANLSQSMRSLKRVAARLEQKRAVE
ncbi:hypothetical protein DYI37_13270 [Fulvimarina endophytica]|uniref:Uncharacterized protein n=1 Tax=Fulvimarina endophytica TaxID=2293836 RepID=A0A371X104_9HYPH|nr:hypothetical protein [Fulvimarina endophytica]RFC62920.1 hypothetical protein DYI37_13270 [Fulvimarina endophytica]